ncbi:hypothetical protein MBLNU459_g1354t1 [Dothideomycetes sp. NU459]
MSSENPRRAATTPLPVPQGYPNPPPAPPLPPQQRARNALNRFLGFPGKATDGDGDGRQDGVGSRTEMVVANRMITDLGRLPSLSAHDASAIHRTGLEISSLSINDEGTHALLAGREIFKTVRVDEGSCAEDANLRAAIRTFDAHVSGPPKDPVNIHDVAWGKGNYGNFIAAAVSNGPIVLYDLNHPGVEVARLYEHRRQVHRVTFNPHAGQQFLSGSQDGTVKLWDLRDLRRDAATFSSRFTSTGQHEGVRDVKWSPTDIFGMALCTDGGFVQQWDYRKPKAPPTRIAAHNRPCATIDWHPDGKHLLSCSADKTVKVWNLSAEGRRNKAAYEIKAPYPVRNARWRPSCQSSVPKDKGARQCTQIVSSYEREYPMLHIWDFRRPYLPFREIESDTYTTSPTDLLWHSQDLLWTVGREGIFKQHDVKYAPKVMDRRNMQALAVSPLGEINVATQRRAGRMRPGLGRGDSDNFLQHRSSNASEKFEHSTSRGSADDSLDETFLSSSFAKRHARTASMKPSKPHVEQPQVQEQTNARTMTMEEIFNGKRIFKPGQGSTRGRLPGSPNNLVMQYFAQRYKARPLTEPPSVEAFLKVHEIFESNAFHAQQASYYRMSQSWRLAGQATATALRRRAERHRELRVKGSIPRKDPHDESPFAKRARKFLTSERRMSSKPGTPMSRPVRAMEALHPVQAESSSNLATPLAKPVSERMTSAKNGHLSLSELSHDEEIALPPSLLSPTHLAHQGEKDRVVSTSSAYGEHSWYGSAQALDDKRAEISVWRAQPKAPLDLEHAGREGVNIRPTATRHDSEESFVMFPSLSSRAESIPSSSVVSSKSALMDVVRENLTDESPQGSMNLGSSSSSEPMLGQSIARQTFFGSAASPSHSPVRPSTSATESNGEGKSVESESRLDSRWQPANTPARDISRDMQTLALNNQQSFTSESEALSSEALSLHKEASRATEVENMEASGTIVPKRSSRRLHSSGSNMTKPTILGRAGESAPAILANAIPLDVTKEPFVPADFFASDKPVNTEEGQPFSLITMLDRLLQYHTIHVPDAQAATYFLQLLSPLLPETYPLSQSEIDTTIAVYSDHFSSLGYTDGEIYTLMQSSFEHLIKSGLQPLQAESIIATYHAQLQHMALYTSAAYLRRLSYPTYPAVWEQGVKDVQINLLCGQCKKAINNPSNKFRCETCDARQQPCPICWCVASPFETPLKSKSAHHPPYNAHPDTPDNDHDPDRIGRPALYSTCLLCNHSAHTSCMRVWHASSDGACPVSGCLCACTAGLWRDRNAAADKQVTTPTSSHKKVRDDEWQVGESRAVQAVAGPGGIKKRPSYAGGTLEPHAELRREPSEKRVGFKK